METKIAFCIQCVRGYTIPEYWDYPEVHNAICPSCGKRSLAMIICISLEQAQELYRELSGA